MSAGFSTRAAPIIRQQYDCKIVAAVYDRRRLRSAKEMLDENPNPAEADIKEALSGVISRCTGRASCRRTLLQLA